MFADYVRKWLEGYRDQVDLVSWHGYCSCVDVHIAPYFEEKKLKLDAVTVNHIGAYYAQKLTQGRADGKGGLFGSTIHRHAVVLFRLWG